MKMFLPFYLLYVWLPMISSHQSYVSLLLQSKCSEVHSLEPYQKCDFVQNTADCHIESRLFNYTTFVFCNFGIFGRTNHDQTFNGILLIVWCLVLFLILSIVSDIFFCPGLASMSKMFHLSENIAGVTLLAFGNGAPNFSGSIFDPDKDSELMYSETLGSTIFMIGIIAGLIAISKPFKVVNKDFTRDAIFLIMSVLVVQALINDDHYNWIDAAITLGLYVIYLTYVYVEYRFDKKKMEKSIQSYRKSMSLPFMHLTSIRPEIKAQLQRIEEQLQFQLHDKDCHPVNIDVTRRVSILPQTNNTLGESNIRIFQLFINEINPMNNLKIRPYWKTPYEVLQALILFALRLLLPIFDFTVDRHGWNKLLNILHIFTLPLMGMFVTLSTEAKLFGTSLSLYSICLSMGLATFVFFTSRTDCPPKYHWIFALLNFLGSNLIIFAASAELASALNTLGLLFNCTAAIIGVTVLAIGNSVSDLLANITLAKQGHQRMAFAACFGGSIFNILFTIGFTFLSKIFESPDYNPYARRGPLGFNCIIFIILAVIFLLFGFFINRFQARSTYGYMLVIMYIIFIIQCIFSEIQILHSYGTDHHNEEVFE